MTYLLDTNVCSEYLRGKNPVTFNVRQNYSKCSVSSIVAAELFVWGFRIKSSPRWLPAIENFLAGIQIMNVTLDVSRTAGSLRALFLDQGQPAPPQDLLIAATALTHGLILVTHNTQDFGKISELRIVDWQSS